ncbi:MAG: hypothetical protein WC480_03405 [Patescibacteria group bacterium]
MAKQSLIRTIYLYLFALVGLVLLVIGGVGLVNMGLKIYVFTQADKTDQLYFNAPYPPVAIEQIDQALANQQKVEIAADQQITLEAWLVDYRSWQEQQKDFDYLTANRQREASRYLSMIIIGLPLYLVHWLIIRKESRKLLNEVA